MQTSRWISKTPDAVNHHGCIFSNPVFAFNKTVPCRQMKDEAAMLRESLREELDRLKRVSGANADLEVLWVPRADSAKEGEVVGSRIYIYSTSFADALETLRHEFLDAIVCGATAPYVELVNALLSVISERAYRKKEDVVESLAGMAGSPRRIRASAAPEKDLAAV